MSILRFSTLSLTLAIVIFSLGYVDSSIAAPPEPCVPDDDRKRCKPKPGDDPSGVTYTVDLVGPDFANADVRGAFEFDDAGEPSPVSATLDKGGLKGAGSFAMTRPGGVSDCSGDDQNACMVWNDVFNLCGLLGPYSGGELDDMTGPTLLETFAVEPGGWEVAKGGGRIWLSLGFTIVSPLDPDDPLFTDRLSVSLQLTGPCIDPVGDSPCEQDLLIPTATGAAGATKNDLTDARIHLRGKGGVTHNAECHADNDVLYPYGSTLVITAIPPP